MDMLNADPSPAAVAWHSPQEPLLSNVPDSQAVQLPAEPDVQFVQLVGQSTQTPSMPTVLAGQVLPEWSE